MNMIIIKSFEYFIFDKNFPKNIQYYVALFIKSNKINYKNCIILNI